VWTVKLRRSEFRDTLSAAWDSGSHWFDSETYQVRAMALQYNLALASTKVR
jgi:hypothetical protein